MIKILLVLFVLPLLCCGKDQHTKQIQEKPEQVEKNVEELEAELEAKLKIEYEKRFGVPISDFELSIKSVTYYALHISITRTAIGAFAEYGDNVLEVELGINEWLDFINALHKYKVKEWFGEYNNSQFDILNCNLEIILSSSSEPIKLTCFKYNPPNWNEFTKLMDDLATKIKKRGAAKLEAKLKLEYEKRFGMPMTDFELSINRVHFYYFNTLPPKLDVFAVRKINGVFIKYESNPDIKLELGIVDWLDFLNALRKIDFKKWKREYRRSIPGTRRNWLLSIYTSDDDQFLSYGNNDFPPDWDEFIKVMYDLEAKIKEKAEAK